MNKLFMAIIYKNGKEITRAKGNDIEKLKRWAIDCKREDSDITFELFCEE